MRLICPHCMSGVTVPDDAAGTEVPCPNCGKSFPTPARYSPAVAPEPPAPPPVPASTSGPPPVPEVAPAPHAPVPPPGFVPPPVPPPLAPSGFLPPTSAPATTPTPAGYTHSFGITFSPHVFAWLPAILLALVLVCTFFPWVECRVSESGSAVYWQRPWGAAFSGTPGRNYRLEEANIIPGGWLDKSHSDWKVLVPFFLLLFFALSFAWAERGLRSVDPRKIPLLAKLWPYHNMIVAGCATLILVLLLLQWANGFGMERAIKQHIGEQFAERREKAANSPAGQDRLQNEEEKALNAYNLEHTTWMHLALACSALAVVACVVRAGLDARGSKPPPKLLLHY